MNNQIKNNNQKISVNGLKDLLSCNIQSNQTNQKQNTQIYPKESNSNSNSNKNLDVVEIKSNELLERKASPSTDFNDKDDYDRDEKDDIVNQDETDLNCSNDLSIINDLINNEINEVTKNEHETPSNLKFSCFIPNLSLDNEKAKDSNNTDNNDSSEIPEVMLKIIKNMFKTKHKVVNNKFTKICDLLTTEILTFSSEGIGASEKESKWANHILEYI